MSDTLKIDKEVLEFVRNRLDARLPYLTGAQRQKLASILGVPQVDSAALNRKQCERAIDLIDRQVRKDKA